MEFPLLFWGLYSLLLLAFMFGKQKLGKMRIPAIIILIAGLLVAQYGGNVVIMTYYMLLSFIVPIIIVALHEGGHVIGALIQNIKIESVLVLPFFGQVKLAPQTITNKKHFWMVWMGPAMSLPMLAMGYIWPNSDFAISIAIFGAIVGVFNSVPIMQLDGGHLLARMLDRRVTEYGSLVIQLIFSIIFLIVAWATGVAFVFIVLLGLPVAFFLIPVLKGKKKPIFLAKEEQENTEEESMGREIVMIKEKLHWSYAIVWLGVIGILLLGFFDLGGYDKLLVSLTTFIESLK